jgi:hypothetical protein
MRFIWEDFFFTNITSCHKLYELDFMDFSSLDMTQLLSHSVTAFQLQ